jgi:hypothetical protein
MSEKAAASGIWKRSQLWAGLVFLGSGLLLNCAIERWNLSDFQELLFPPVAFWVSMTGAVLLVRTFWIEARSPRFPFQLAAAAKLSLGLTALYAVLFIIVETTDKGAGTHGDCEGLYGAVTASVEVPQSVSEPSVRGVFCQTAMLGMFLRRYDILLIYGVTDQFGQDHALRSLAEYRREHDTKPIRVEFYEKENWTPLTYDKQGRGIGGERGPERRLRVATIR